MKQFIALGALLLHLNTAAACPSEVPSSAPDIPDGAVASEQSMYTAMETVQTYVHTIEVYLECQEALLTSRYHNELVDRVSDSADAYNRELLRFRQRDEVLAIN